MQTINDILMGVACYMCRSLMGINTKESRETEGK